MTHIVAALGVLRSNLIARRDVKHTGRTARYNKTENMCLLPVISQLCSERGSNGYRRITARLNRLLPKRVNPKRVYSLMKEHHLLWHCYIGRPDERCHAVKIVTLKSNMRWCSDGFEIKCWNKDIVGVAFLDCCDREAMRYVVTTGGITAVIVQDFLVETMEYRFASRDQLPDAITVMMQLPAWFADYNASHPHKGLKMKSPWEYQKQLALSVH